MQYKFQIPIGDWSGDGHGQCDVYYATSNKLIIDVREAYFAAKKKLPKKMCPENFCHDYEDGVIPDSVIKLLKKYKCNLAKVAEDEGFSSKEMAEYVVWFINQGNPDVNAILMDEEDVPTLSFYGYDDKKRHIQFIGYGLFS